MGEGPKLRGGCGETASASKERVNSWGSSRGGEREEWYMQSAHKQSETKLKKDKSRKKATQKKKRKGGFEPSKKSRKT